MSLNYINPIKVQHTNKVPINGILEQLKNTKNVVTQSVLKDCIIDRLKRRDYD